MKRKHRYEITAAPAITTGPPRPVARPTGHPSEPNRPQASWLAQATGFTVGFTIAIICLATKTAWHMALLWVLIGTVGSASLVFLIMSWLFVLLRLKRWSREEPEASGQADRGRDITPVPRQEITVNVEERGRINRCILFSPDSRPGGLATYAAALIRDNETRATFSYAGGRHIHGARFYGYTPAEFAKLEKEAKRAKLISRRLRNQPYELTTRGRLVFTRIARREMAELQLSPAP